MQVFESRHQIYSPVDLKVGTESVELTLDFQLNAMFKVMYSTTTAN